MRADDVLGLDITVNHAAIVDLVYTETELQRSLFDCEAGRCWQMRHDYAVGRSLQGGRRHVELGSHKEIAALSQMIEQ